MKCPNDNATLVMSERHGIEIDYCPECRGVWLDRGELDKIVERAGADSAQPYREPHQAPVRHREPYPEHRPSHDPYHHKKHKKESFLGDIFDF